MTYVNPYWVRTAVREIRTLKQKNQSFTIYLTLFRRILENLHWDDEAIENQLYQGLSKELKEIRFLHGSLDDNLESFITN